MKRAHTPEADVDGRPALYWTPVEFGGVVRLSAKSVYRLVKDDPSFPVVKILGSIRIPKDRALKWLDARTQGRPRLVRAGESPALERQHAGKCAS